jgi:prepilin-type N-terminal cleavage/methylation domain-containing protein
VRSLTGRGFTLVELLVGLVLFGMLGLVTYKLFLTSERVNQTLNQRIDQQANLRAAVSILPSELRELDASEGDIVAMGPDSIRIRGMRQLTFICLAPTLGGAQPLTGLTMVVRGTGPLSPMFFGSRTFNAATDSLLVYYEGSTAVRTDDAWLPAKLTAITAQNCPDGTAGLKLTFNVPTLVNPQANVNGNIAFGAPVWGFEYNVTYRSYLNSDGKWYVGFRNSSGIQPLIGPLTGSGGLLFSYYDTTGTVTAVPANVAQVKVRVATQTAQPVSGQTTNPVDSITTWVALRNNLRRQVNQ